MIFLFEPFWIRHLNFKSDSSLFLRFEKETRYYEFRLQKDLFNDWNLMLNNGRIKSKLGQSRVLAFDSYYEAIVRLGMLIEIRTSKTYHMVYASIENMLLYLIIESIIANKKNRKRQSSKRASMPASNKPEKTQKEHKTSDSAQAFFNFEEDIDL